MALVMAKKKPGRPKAAEALKSIASLKGTEDFEQWIDELVNLTGSRTRVTVIWQALKEYGASKGHRPMPSR
jgi:hypothetical protein